MSYIGRDIRTGAFRQLDDISSGFDGSDTTHTMQVNSTNVSVGDVNQILLSLGGVIQKPGTDFTVSSSTLTFTTAPAANTSFFAILLGSDNGGTTTPTDGSVTTAKLADTSVTSAKLSGNLVTPGTLDVNGQELILDADADTSITADTDDQVDIKVGGTDRLRMAGNNIFLNGGTDARIQLGSGGSGANTVGNDTVHIRGEGDHMKFMAAANGTYTFENNGTSHMSISADGEILKPLLPAFRAKPSSDQDNISSSSTIVFGTEVFDQGDNFASNTFTAPVTGKYQLSFVIYIEDLDDGAAYTYITLATSNQSYYHILDPAAMMSAPQTYYTFTMSVLADMDAGDQALIQYHQSGGNLTSDVTVNSHFTGFLVC